MRFPVLQNCKNVTNLESDAWIHSLSMTSVLKSNNMTISLVIYISKDFFDPRPLNLQKILTNIYRKPAAFENFLWIFRQALTHLQSSP